MASPSRPGPIQAIVGEDTYLAEEALERVLGAAIGADRQEALQVLYGDEKKWEDVLGSARTGSLFASRRAIVVRRADKFAEDRVKEEEEKADDVKGSREDGNDKESVVSPERQKPKRTGKRLPADQHPLLLYLNAPNPDVTLVLVTVRPDRRRVPWSTFFKVLPKEALSDASPLKGGALRARVGDEIRQRGLRLTPEALDHLLTEVGQDLRRLAGELDKLEAWAGGRGSITEDDVDAVLGQGIAQPLYRLGDAFGARDKVTSITLVEQLLADRAGNEALGVALKSSATLYRSLRQVRQARALRESQVPYHEMASRLRLPPHLAFKVKALLEAAKSWSEADLRHALAALARADRRLKRGVNPATTLVAAVAESCGGEGRPTSPRRGR